MNNITIRRVIYGYSNHYVDVTENFCKYMKDNKNPLIVSNQLIGCDPCYGQRKQLIVYSIDGRQWRYDEGNTLVRELSISSSKMIIIRPYGRTGNNMMEHMFALYLQSLIPELNLYCTQPGFLMSFGIHIPIPPQSVSSTKVIVERNQKDWTSLIRKIKQTRSIVIEIIYCCFSHQLYNPLLDTYRLLYQSHNRHKSYDHQYLVISIRLGDIARSGHTVHANMPVIPFSFHRFLIRKTKLKPVFLGQFDTGYISQQLRLAFPEAIFHQSRSIIEDFECLRSAKNLSVAVSTFSFLAGYLSDPDTTVHLPVYGGFNPKDRPDGDFVFPDPRFHYYHFPSIVWTASPQQFSDIVNSPDHEYQEIILC